MKPGKERWLLLAILVVAAVLRLARLDLMEFKFDEAEACRLASQILYGPENPGEPRLPLTGLVSSVGVPNPPLFIYIIALPLVVVNNPLSAAVFIALSNVAAVWLCYFIGKRYFSSFIGLAAAALFALSPWAIVYSRKIWAQDLLPVFACLFLLTAYAFLIDRKQREAFWLIFLFGMLTQLHFSGGSLVFVLLIVLGMGADQKILRWRWVCLGAFAVAILYAPYLWYMVSHYSVGDQPRSDSSSFELLKAIRYTFAASGADSMDALLGSGWKAALPVSIMLGILILWCGWKWCSARDKKGVLLLLWLLSPLACLAVGIRPYPHYFIILYPVLFLVLAAALEKIGERRTGLAYIGLAALLISFAVFDLLILCGIIHQGGTKGEYGIGYRHKADVVRFVVAENPVRPFVWSSDFTLKTKLPPEYRYLLSEELRRRNTPYQSDKPVFGYVVLDTLRDSLSPEGVAATKELRQEKFGPLTVFVVPLQ